MCNITHQVEVVQQHSSLENERERERGISFVRTYLSIIFATFLFPPDFLFFRGKDMEDNSFSEKVGKAREAR